MSIFRVGPIPLIKIRRSHDVLFFIMEIPMPRNMFSVLKQAAEYPTRSLIVGSRQVSQPWDRLKFDMHIDSNAAEVPVKLQSDDTILNTNLAASRLCEILKQSPGHTGPDNLVRQAGHDDSWWLNYQRSLVSSSGVGRGRLLNIAGALQHCQGNAIPGHDGKSVIRVNPSVKMKPTCYRPFSKNGLL